MTLCSGQGLKLTQPERPGFDKYTHLGLEHWSFSNATQFVSVWNWTEVSTMTPNCRILFPSETWRPHYLLPTLKQIPLFRWQLTNIQNSETHQLYPPFQSMHLCCVDNARKATTGSCLSSHLVSYSLACTKHGQTPAPKDAKGILMMRFQFRFI